MNKAELIEVLAARLGDKKTASTALDAVLSEVQSAVAKGERVAITGFGVFEKRVRAARTARNPRTGEAVKVKKTSVPAFRAGAGFKEVVASGRVPKATAARKGAAAKKTTKAAPAKATKTAKTAKATKAAKTTKAASKATTRATATAKAAAKRAPAKKAPAKRAPAKKAR